MELSNFVLDPAQRGSAGSEPGELVLDRTILLVEDNDDDALLMKVALRRAGIQNRLIVVEDGAQAIEYFSGTGAYSDRTQFPLPAVTFLDLKLPLKTGHEVLAWLQQRPDLAGLSVVVLSSSNQRSDVQEAYRLGATSYMIKPPTAEQLHELAHTFKWDWLNTENVVGA